MAPSIMSNDQNIPRAVNSRWRKHQLQGKPVKFALKPIAGWFNVVESDGEQLRLQVVSSLKEPQTIHWVTQKEANSIEMGTDGTFFITG